MQFCAAACPVALVASIRPKRLCLVSLLCLMPVMGQGAVAQTDAGPDRAIASAPADSVVQARLTAAFAQIEPLTEVEVEVRSGVVRLGGRVVQPEDAERAEALARQFEGVLYVVNDIEIETRVEPRLTPALERLMEAVQGGVSRLPLVGIALLIVLLFGLFTWSLGRWDQPPRRLRIRPLVWQFLRRVVQAAVMVIGLLLAFDILGVGSLVGAVLGTAGVAGLALGFAFQDIIENYLAGALLSIQQPFGVNDLVEVSGHEGRVVRLTARELVLLTFEGNHVRLPNATVFKNPTTNYTRNPRRLFRFEVGIGPAEDLVEATQIGRETLDAMNGVMEDPPPFVRIQEVGDSAVVVRIHGWVNQQESDFFKVRSEAVRLVKTALDDAGIDLPEPTYRLQVWQRETPVSEEKKSPTHESAVEQGASIDVAPDHKLEAQVWEDISASDEPNFLGDDDAPGETDEAD